MTTDTVGGVWTFAMTLSRQLCARGHEVHVVTSGPEMSTAQRREAAEAPRLRVHERPSRLEWEDDPRGDLWEELDRWNDSLRRVVDAVDPDALHLNAYAPAAESWGVPTVLTAHSDVETWWRAVHGDRAPAGYDRYRTVVRAALERASAVVAPTRAFAEAVRDAYTLERRISTIYNGIDDPSGSDCNGQPRVLCAGRLWDEAKNIRAIIGAAGAIRGDVVAAGDTSSASLGAGVRWLGRLGADEMRRELAAAAVFAHPARYEPFGLLPLEAARNGCALVLGDIPTLRELWSGAALFVSPDDPGTLADSVNALLGSPELRRAVAHAGRDRATRYSAWAMSREYERLYAVCASDSTRSAQGDARLGATA
jgi:glycosyltransferase involved in cell wall biosynthesis